MKPRAALLVLAGSLLVGPLAPKPAEACGGVTAFVAEDAKALGSRPATGPGGITFYYDKDGNTLLPTSVVKVESALAEAIAKRYLEKKYGRYGHLEFEGFSYDHGDFVYMYHADVPDLAYSVHIGPVSYVTDHAHVHVSALTGDAYGPGCGLGSGIVDMPFDAAAYPKELVGKRLRYVQFDSHFIAKEGPAPTIDGKIDPEEWRGGGHMVITVGSRQKQLTAYGWGGQGQPAVAEPAESFTIELWSLIHAGNISFAVRADTDRWVALLFKDFPHHGMIGDFNDAKLLTVKGIEDYFVAEVPDQKEPAPRKTAGVHTWMASGSLVRDQRSNLVQSAHRAVGKVREYEFTMPLRNADQGDILWDRDQSYMVALLVGPEQEYKGVTDDVWMSDQILIRIGGPSTLSMYLPPYVAGEKGEKAAPPGSHGY